MNDLKSERPFDEKHFEQTTTINLLFRKIKFDEMFDSIL